MKRKGLSLGETMLAATILVLAITGVFLTFMSCKFLNTTNNNMVIAASDAQYILEEIKDLPYSQIASYYPSPLTNLENETITINASEAGGLTTATVTIGWQERGGDRNFALTTKIAR